MSPSANAFPEQVTVTALGTWPGNDPEEAAKVSLGLLSSPHLPALAQLPARGVGSDAVGRTASLLLELPVDVQPFGWRFVDRPGHDHRRAVSALSTDVNMLADVAGAGDIIPPALKVQIMGPISLAAAIHLHYGERALRDYGARRDIAQSLAAGLVLHAEKLREAVPGAQLVLQIDEPEIAAALAGTIPTASGYRTLRSIPASELRQTWSTLVTAAREAGFAQVAINLTPTDTAAEHTAPGAEEARAAETTAWRKALEIALESGLDAVALPLHLLDTGHWEQLAGALESGLGVWAGTVPTLAGRVPPSYSVLEEKIMRPWRGLGLDLPLLKQLRITPDAGLAHLSPQEARTVLNRALELAERLNEVRYA